jgi:hypothetical protein
VIEPGGGALPPPEVSDSAGSQTLVALPGDAAYKLSPKFIQRVIKDYRNRLRKKLTIAAATKMLEQSAVNEVTLVPQAGTPSVRSMDIDSALVAGLASKKGKAIKIRTRLNQITVGRLTPGQTYSVTYKKVYTVKKIKKTYSSRPSPPAIFRKQ